MLYAHARACVHNNPLGDGGLQDWPSSHADVCRACGLCRGVAPDELSPDHACMPDPQTSFPSPQPKGTPAHRHPMQGGTGGTGAACPCPSHTRVVGLHVMWVCENAIGSQYALEHRQIRVLQRGKLAAPRGQRASGPAPGPVGRPQCLLRQAAPERHAHADPIQQIQAHEMWRGGPGMWAISARVVAAALLRAMDPWISLSGPCGEGTRAGRPDRYSRRHCCSTTRPSHGRCGRQNVTSFRGAIARDLLLHEHSPPPVTCGVGPFERTPRVAFACTASERAGLSRPRD